MTEPETSKRPEDMDEVEDEVLEEDLNDANEEEESLNDVKEGPSVSKFLAKGYPEKGTGVIFLSIIPPRFTKKRIQEYFSHFGEIGRIYLQADKKIKKFRKYVEGWVEFKKKKVAKRVAELMNGHQVGGKHRSPAFDTLWSIKYLNGFKWSNLVEQLTYEKNIEEQRLRVELGQARREAKHFVDQVQKGAEIRELEKKVTEKGGVWEKKQKRAVPVSKVIKPKKAKKTALNEKEGAQLLDMIFN